jgi:hypothetical protein
VTKYPAASPTRPDRRSVRTTRASAT